VQQEFRPKIQAKSKSLTRKEKVDALLYQDALRRQQKQRDHDDFYSSNQKSIENWSTSNPTTNRIIVEKCIKDYEFACSDVFQVKIPDIFSYGQMKMVLTHLNYRNETDSVTDNALMAAIWRALHGESKGLITRRNLLAFIIAMHGIAWRYPKETDANTSNIFEDLMTVNISGCEDQSSCEEPPGYLSDLTPEERRLCDDTCKRFLPLSFDDDAMGDVRMDEKKVRVIQKIFDVLLVNRLAHENGRVNTEGDDRVSRVETEPQPHSNPNSARLARKYRDRLVTQASEILRTEGVDIDTEKLGVAEFLNIAGVLKEFERRKQTMAKDEMIMKECSFHPVTNMSSSVDLPKISNYDSRVSNGTIDRCHELYELGRRRNQNLDRNQDDIEFERCQTECTFVPSVNRNLPNHILQRGSEQRLPKNTEKVVARMRMARQEREKFHEASAIGKSVGESGFVFSMEGKLAASQVALTNESKYASKPPRPFDSYRGQSGKASQHIDKNYETKDEQLYNTREQEESDPLEDGDDDGEESPMLYVDVNLGGGRSERIIVKRGDTAQGLAHTFAMEHHLDAKTTQKLTLLLEEKVRQMLPVREDEIVSRINDDDLLEHSGDDGSYNFDPLLDPRCVV
jgi:hypothetical protein